jgi:hypothetical protein
MSCSLHLITTAGEIHLKMPGETRPTELLDTCTEAMRGARVVAFSDCMAPGAVDRTTIVVNFTRVSVAWVDPG